MDQILRRDNIIEFKLNCSTPDITIANKALEVNAYDITLYLAWEHNIFPLPLSLARKGWYEITEELCEIAIKQGEILWIKQLYVYLHVINKRYIVEHLDYVFIKAGIDPYQHPRCAGMFKLITFWKFYEDMMPYLDPISI